MLIFKIQCWNTLYSSYLELCIIYMFTLSTETDGLNKLTQIRHCRMGHLVRAYTVCYSSSNILDKSTGKKNKCERNCFILKDVKFTENFYPLMLKSKIEYFYPLNRNFNVDFQNSMLKYPLLLLSRALYNLHVYPKYWNRWPEQTDPDQTLQNGASSQGLYCLLLIQQHFG